MSSEIESGAIMSYVAAEHRYDSAPFRAVGRSGLKLPPISLGLWHNFGRDTAFDRQRDILRTAFDLGITHFDLANNYGTPYGSAETNFGRVLREDFRAYRDELIVSTKAGWDMWPGPYGQGGGCRKYLLASLDQSLQRLGLEYVDIFYSHRFDPDTPLQETAGALATAVQQGKALYVGISAYSPQQTLQMAALLSHWRIPLLIHQPRYNLFDRAIENGLFAAVEQVGAGMIAFSPLAQGILSSRYLNSIPADSRAARGTPLLSVKHISEDVLRKVRALHGIASARGQTLAQLALAWVLRDPRMTSALVGASSVEQLRENVAALRQLAFSTEELAAIDLIVAT
jgi:L-glyceraldehyde 3-phosphate reductase